MGQFMSKGNPCPVFRDAGDDENRFFLRRIGIKPEGMVCNQDSFSRKRWSVTFKRGRVFNRIFICFWKKRTVPS